MCIPVEPSKAEPLHIEHFEFFMFVCLNTEPLMTSSPACGPAFADNSIADATAASSVEAFAAAAIASGSSCAERGGGAAVSAQSSKKVETTTEYPREASSKILAESAQSVLYSSGEITTIVPLEYEVLEG